MDWNDKRENVLLFHKMLQKELNLAEHNLKLMKKKTDENILFILDQFNKNQIDQLCIFAYDTILTEVSSDLDILRKFNLKVEYTLQSRSNNYSGPSNSNTQNDGKYLSILNYAYNENSMANDNGVLDSSNSNDKDDAPLEQFTYCKPDLSNYENNECTTIKGIITYVVNNSDLFYIIDKQHPNSKKYSDYLKKHTQKMNQKLKQFPMEGEVFGVILDGDLFRAVRENDRYTNNRDDNGYTFKVYLIDIGEITDIEFSTDLYLLPDEFKQLQSQAIPCKLISLNSNDKQFLQTHVHTWQKMKVLKLENSVLHIHIDNLSDNKLSERHKNKTLNSLKSSTSPINHNLIHGNHSSSSSRNETNSKAMYIKNEKNIDDIDSISNSTFESCEDNFSVNCDIEPQKYAPQLNQQHYKNNQFTNYSNSAQLTEEDLEIFREEPLNTTRSLKAVLGYEPKDFKRICPFYNPKTQACFKGNRCKLEHVEQNEDGWTRDKVSVPIGLKNKPVLPEIGEEISLICTSIINMQYFYAQYISKYDPNKINFTKLMEEMNSTQQISKYVPINFTLAPAQLVIARYKDDKWYRAQVIENDGDETRAKVFYLDFGYICIINIKNHIRQWENYFGNLPFQAIKCQIVNIEENEEKHQGYKFLRNHLLNKMLKVKVISIAHDDTLILEVYDSEGYSIGEQLISFGLANHKSLSFVPKSQLTPV